MTVHGVHDYRLWHWPRLHEKGGAGGPDTDALKRDITRLRVVWLIVTVISTMAVLLLWTTALGL